MFLTTWSRYIIIIIIVDIVFNTPDYIDMFVYVKNNATKHNA